MKGKFFLFTLCAVLTAGAAQAQGPVDMKPGLWEVRILKMEQDGKDMLPDLQAQAKQAFARLSPEQRKQMGGNPLASRLCVSPAMTNGNWLTSLSTQQSDCDPIKMNRNGNRATFESNCRQDGGTVVGKGEIVNSGNRISIKEEMVATRGNEKHTLGNETQMQFIASDCGGIRPLDETVRQMQSGPAKQQSPPRK